MPVQMNFQQLDNRSMEYVTVGSWNNGTLNLNKPVQVNIDTVLS